MQSCGDGPAGLIPCSVVNGNSHYERALIEKLFETFPCHHRDYLRCRRRWGNRRSQPSPKSPNANDQADGHFARAFRYRGKVWHKRRKKQGRYDLPILCDLETNAAVRQRALKSVLSRAGEEMGIGLR